MIEIFILGTSSSFPTERRNHPCILLRYEGNYFLFDCGEGAQLRLRKVKISPVKINSIFITHWHGDHVLGLPGLIQSMTMNNREAELNIYGPPGTSKYFYHCLRCCAFRPCFKINVFEVGIEGKEIIIDEEDFKIECIPVPHDIPALAYSFETKPYRRINIEYTKQFGLIRHPILKKLQKGEPIEWKGRIITPEEATYIVPGRKFVYSGDMAFCEEFIEFAKGSDVLLIESTYLEKDKGKEDEKLHLSAKEAGIIGKRANARYLVLTHFSQRYSDVSELVEEAKKEFGDNVIAAEDFMKITIKKDGTVIFEKILGGSCQK